jgi:hypothetical protein
MADLQGNVGELQMNIQVVRKETGKVEDYQLVGFVDEEKLKQLQEAGILPKEEK